MTAKTFWNSNSKPVRLPKELRFEPGTEWPADFWRAFEGMPEGFERPAQVAQRREDIERTENWVS
jgi:hypothetical protein